MARLFFVGAEIDGAASTATQNVGPDGQKIGSGTLTRNTSAPVRSGAASYKFDSTGTNQTVNVTFTGAANASTTYYLRAFVCFANLPASTVTVLTFGSGNVPRARLTSGGKMELWNSSAQVGSDSSATISADSSTWYRVELKMVLNGLGQVSDSELLLDGTSVATGATGGSPGTQPAVGWIDAPGASKVMYADDVAENDSTGSVNNSYPGNGKVVILVPTADSAVAAGWVDDANSATNIFDAVANRPPKGIADTTTGDGTHQIRDATTGGPESYDATMTTYTAAGINASDTINAIAPWICTGAPVTTSAVTGSFGVVSNPTIANINFDDTGKVDTFWAGAAAGTYGAGWKWSPGTLTETPSVTLGTAPVARVTKIDSSTRIGMVCFMGMYVDYTPVSGTVYQKAGWGFLE